MGWCRKNAGGCGMNSNRHYTDPPDMVPGRHMHCPILKIITGNDREGIEKWAVLATHIATSSLEIYTKHNNLHMQNT